MLVTRILDAANQGRVRFGNSRIDTDEEPMAFPLVSLIQGLEKDGTLRREDVMDEVDRITIFNRKRLTVHASFVFVDRP